MRKLRRYISRNWIWIIAGLLLTVKAVQAAYEWRGYWSYGGEYFTLPLVLLGVETVRNVIAVVTELFEFEMEEVDGSGRSRQNRSRVQRNGMRYKR